MGNAFLFLSPFVIALAVFMLWVRRWQKSTPVPRPNDFSDEPLLGRRVAKIDYLTPSPVASPFKIDTEGAIEDMRLAHSYLDDWIEKKDSQHVLGLAARYISSARAKDPNAKLILESKGETFSFSQDDLSGEALFYESQIYSHDQATPEQLRKARDILERALAYAPSSVQYRSHLANVHLNLHDRDNALAVARKAIAVNSRDLDARKLMDRIEAAPITVAPTWLENNPGCLVALASLMFFFGFVTVVVSFFGGVPESLPVFIFIGGAVLWFYGRSKEKQQILDQAIADIKRKGKG